MNDHHFNYKTQILKKTLDFVTPHNTIQDAFVLKLLKMLGFITTTHYIIFNWN